MKNAVQKLGYGIATLAIITLALIALFPEQASLFMAVVVSNITANQKPPEIVQGQITDKDWLKWDEANKKVTAAVRRQFPYGTSDTTIRTKLRDQGFKDEAPPEKDCVPPNAPMQVGRTYAICPLTDAWKRTMRYEWGGLPCVQSISITWSADKRGRVIKLDGQYGGACL